jgi:hypothetical protein
VSGFVGDQGVLVRAYSLCVQLTHMQTSQQRMHDLMACLPKRVRGKACKHTTF